MERENEGKCVRDGSIATELKVRDLRAELPKVIGIVRHVLDRPSVASVFDPAAVQGPADLFPYLILGPLDEPSFQISGKGWSARWNGFEADSFLEIKYDRDAGRYEASQQWHGAFGHSTNYPATVPIERLIAQCLYPEFPKSWTERAKAEFEARYDLTYVGHAGHFGNAFCAIPDGQFMEVALPVHLSALPALSQRLNEIILEARLPFPVSAFAFPILGALNYLEGKTPDWSRDPGGLLRLAFEETGLIPFEAAYREADERRAAWTIRRHVFLAALQVPFAGLPRLLELLAGGGVLPRKGTPARPWGMRAFIVPLGPGHGPVAFWDEDKAVRAYWHLGNPKSHMELALEAVAQTKEDAAKRHEAAIDVGRRQAELMASPRAK